MTITSQKKRKPAQRRRAYTKPTPSRKGHVPQRQQVGNVRTPSFAQERARGTVPLPPAVHVGQRAVSAPKPPPQKVWRPRKASVRLHLGMLAARNVRLYIFMGTALMLISLCGALTLGVGLVYANGILPSVRSLGVALGGASPDEAANMLRGAWGAITITDGERSFAIAPADYGVALDAQATAQLAWEQGRGQGSFLPAVLGGVDVPPVVTIEANTLRIGLSDLAAEFERSAVNAGVQLVAGEVQPTAPINGSTLDIEATVASLQANAGEILVDGVLEVIMRSVQPAITDAAPLVAEAQRVLSSPLPIRAYDPIRDEWLDWSVAPETWANWITIVPDGDRPLGFRLSVQADGLRGYLAQQNDALGAARYINLDEAVNAVQATFAANRTDAWVRIYHNDRQHVVQAGQTIISIAWDYGVPYPWIQQANGGIENISVGQTITIPSADNFLDFPVIPNKRIIVSISQQRAWFYENGGVKWEWLVSTGIQSSPTWPGIYQIISHEINAYASNWDLWMPYFMGVYRPIPGTDFVNGFHGFPTRGSSQLLWTNSLGTRVTYGCILLSNDNVALLWDWAEEGVVVEIRA